MNSEEIMLEQYKLYTEQKEKFVDRSFMTNKFYLLIIFALILTIYLTKDFSFVYGLSSIMVFSASGMAVCALWWMNVDAYNFLIKVKLAKVIEELEKKLPFQPYTQEFLVIKDLRKNKREFMFADIQKSLALIVFLLFLFLFSYEILSLIILNYN
ncbi:MAG: hypothetical protein PHC64_03265 [Candidatus Gastranaerophilales bacterium]|nr:hypothetical protein [Candidatus Gastranaerophilales bacterium]